MSNPIMGAFISVMAAQAGRAYLDKHGHSNFVARWGTALVWSLIIPAAFSSVSGIADATRGNIREVFNVGESIFLHAAFFFGGLFWSTCVTRYGPQPPTPWRVKGRFIAWWATLIAGWMLLLHTMIGADWGIALVTGSEPFLPYVTLIENRPMNSWQLSSIYWCFWVAFALNIYAWRRSGKLIPKEDESKEGASHNAPCPGESQSGQNH